MIAPIHELHRSNLLTYLALGLALAAVATAVNAGNFAAAGAFLAAAALADTFDGRFARRFVRTDRQRAIGAQLDSLVDAIVFGLTPIVVLNALPGQRGGLIETVWWSAAFCYALATVTRLSFYNVELDESRFVGVPMPAIALIWSTCLLWPVSWGIVPIVSVACAMAMVAPVAIPRPRGAAFAAFALWGMSLVTVHVARLMF
jgi:CDP-diacylglycerol--serine O-phosphatidyltransferase